MEKRQIYFNISKLFFLLIICFCTNNLFAQADPSFFTKTITPMTPEMSNLSRYAMQQPNLSNGLPQQNIPLYTLKEKDISYNLSLFYNYSGFRIREEATNAGLGWGVTEGTIVRIVKHVPDEHSGLTKRFQQFPNAGIPTAEEIGYGYLDPYADWDPWLAYTPYNLTANRLANKQYDAQPDLYVFNFNGYSGRFFWIDASAVKLDYNDLKIEKDSTNNVFLITTPDGIKYSFGKHDETTTNPSTVYVPSWTGQRETFTEGSTVTGWRLTQIKSNITQAQVDFDYDPDGRTETIPFSEINTITLTGYTPTYGTGVVYYSYSFANQNTVHYYSSWRLKEILSDNHKITFSTTSRLDISGGSAIDEIKVYNRLNLSQSIKTIKFNHGYFGNTSSASTCYLKLSGLQIDGDGQNDEYSFSYINDDAYHTSHGNKQAGIDHWGYWNGNGGGSLLPLTTELYNDLTSSGMGTTMVSWANRNPDFFYAVDYALEKVQYPTKGYTKISYESAGGRGIRVASLEDNDNLQSTFKYYTYHDPWNTSGTIPAPQYQVNYYGRHSCGSYWTEYPSIADHVKVFSSALNENIPPYAESSNFYDLVTEYIGDAIGTGGKTEYNFTRFQTVKPLMIAKKEYKYGTSIPIRKEEYFYSENMYRYIYHFGIPELLSMPALATTGGTYGHSSGPIDPLGELASGGPFDYMLSDYFHVSSGVGAYWYRLDSTKITQDGLSSLKKLFYTTNRDPITNAPIHTNVIKTEETLSDGNLLSKYFYYPGDLDPDNTSLTLGPTEMITYNLIGVPLKTRIFKGSNLIYKEKSTFIYDGTNNLLLRSTFESSPNGTSIQKINYEYDSHANLIKVQSEGGPISSFKWGYNNNFLNAKAINASNLEFFYEDFEDNTTPNAAHTGFRSATGSYYLNFTIPNGRTYVYSYWSFISGAWIFSGELPYTAPVTITATNIDDIRVYPKDAQIITFNYNPIYGIISQTDAKSKTSYYEYDGFGRLKNTRDQFGNITKSFCYNYAGQLTNCNGYTGEIDIPSELVETGAGYSTVSDDLCFMGQEGVPPHQFLSIYGSISLGGAVLLGQPAPVYYIDSSGTTLAPDGYYTNYEYDPLQGYHIYLLQNGIVIYSFWCFEF